MWGKNQDVLKGHKSFAQACTCAHEVCMCKLVTFPVLHWACPALSSSRTVIKEELQSHSKRSLQQTSNSSLKNPLKPAGLYIFPALPNPKILTLFPHIAHDSVVNLGIFHCILLFNHCIVSFLFKGKSIPILFISFYMRCLAHFRRYLFVIFSWWHPSFNHSNRIKADLRYM